MNTSQIEQFAALAANWSEAEEASDHAASVAFEDELHARLTIEQIRNLRVCDAEADEVSSTQTAHVRGVLATMWNNASVRLD